MLHYDFPRFTLGHERRHDRRSNFEDVNMHWFDKCFGFGCYMSSSCVKHFFVAENEVFARNNKNSCNSKRVPKLCCYSATDEGD